MAGIIVVADKNRGHSEKLADLLMRAGHEVVQATQGQQVIRLLLKNDVQAVLIDTDVSGLKCPESIHILKAVDSELPIIVMSGKTDKKMEQAVRIAGVFFLCIETRQ